MASAGLWSLDPVVVELQMCPAPTAVEMENIMIPGKVEFLASNTGAVAQKFNNAYDAPNISLPVVPAVERVKDPCYLHPRTLKVILGKERLSNEGVRFNPPLRGTFDAQQAALDLIDHVDDMEHIGLGSTLDFHSPVMDRYVKSSPHDEEAGMLFRSQSGSMSIMACGATLPLNCSALTSYTEIHLLTGVRVYVVYPPTPHNTLVVGSYFQGLGEAPAPDHTDVFQELEGGVTFIQRPGQIVYIPPYCPAVVFATKTSAGMSFRFRRAEGLPFRLRHLDLLRTQIAATDHQYQHAIARSLEYHITQLFKDLHSVLGTLDATYDQVSVIIAIGAEWKEAYSRFRGLVERYVSDELKKRILKNVPKLWASAVQAHGLEECPVCQQQIGKLGVGFFEHFRMEHWSTVKQIKLPVRAKEAKDVVRKRPVAVVAVADTGEEMEEVDKRPTKKARAESTGRKKKVNSTQTRKNASSKKAEEYKAPTTRPSTRSRRVQA